MKKYLTVMAALMLVAASCKKSEQPSDYQILNNVIGEIIPQKYLDTLKQLGLGINEGTTPPNIEGIYIVSPLILQKTNIPNDYVIGYQFADEKMKYYNQSTKNFSIQLLIKSFPTGLTIIDTSIATAISGSGNNFTVYGKTRSIATNGDEAVFAKVISGTKEGGTIMNLRYGLINVDNSKGGTYFIKEGQARIAIESDGISTPTTVFRASTSSNSKYSINAAVQ